MYDIVLISVDSPIMLGIYKHSQINQDSELLFSLAIEGQTSHILPLLMSMIFSRDTPMQHICENLGILQNKNLNGKILENIALKCKLKEYAMSYDLLKSSGNFSLQYMDFILQNKNTDKTQLFTPMILLPQQDSEGHQKQYVTADILESLSLSFIQILHLLSYFHEISGIYYARGVGSLSAIKLTHIFLQTLYIVKKIPLYAINSFYFSNYNEIKAFGNLSFFYENSHNDRYIKNLENKLTNYHYEVKEQKTDSLDSHLYNCISLKRSSGRDLQLLLPMTLNKSDFKESCTPLYITPPL
ncbi:hypothetical protein CQA53_07030 [Helicobacter didelphidarum]|uniref:Uncharacterized protein n=1 Tax=Helicobacter didelphidarum TaxID=2040648 RepID=A0A3D8IIM4_9HELI|nr:hypothetical protein [Helicobacter didelphidarum]RDU64988.1 hypothetical protein CQA53_07030 [Helicobacter didelphidarum]